MNDSGARLGRWVLAATAMAQAVSPAVAGFDQGEADDPVVVPPGPFFAVWGVVVLGCLAVAARGFPALRAGLANFRRLHVPLALAQAGFVLWLVVAAVSPALTVPVFALMLTMLVVALRRAPVAVGPAERQDRALTDVVLGVYAGWSAAALWINVATVVERASSALLAALLVGAVLSELALVVAVCRTPWAAVAAGAAGAWALLGVALSSSTTAPTLALVAVVGCAALVVTVLRAVRSDPTAVG